MVITVFSNVSARMEPHVVMSMESVAVLLAGLAPDVLQVIAYNTHRQTDTHSDTELYPIIYTTECLQGRYGQNCGQDCTCRNDTECHHITGSCSCQPGYTGDDCKEGETARHGQLYAYCSHTSL